MINKTLLKVILVAATSLISLVDVGKFKIAYAEDVYQNYAGKITLNEEEYDITLVGGGTFNRLRRAGYNYRKTPWFENSGLATQLAYRYLQNRFGNIQLITDGGERAVACSPFFVVGVSVINYQNSYWGRAVCLSDSSESMQNYAQNTWGYDAEVGQITHSSGEFYRFPEFNNAAYRVFNVRVGLIHDAPKVIQLPFLSQEEEEEEEVTVEEEEGVTVEEVEAAEE
ncbi:hypothetical protein U2F10_21785 [Leptothoe sp. EHU-05/26/07-4]